MATVMAAWGALADAEQMIVVYGPRVPPAHCSATRARPVALADFAANPDRYEGLCLRISGLLIGRMLFANEDEYYRRGPYENGPQDPPALRRWIGLYPSDRAYDAINRYKASRAEVIGVAGQCRDLDAKNVIMVMGTCHYTDVPYLAVANLHATPVPFVRMIGDAARARVGDIHIAAADDPRRTAADAAAQQWLSAIEAQDITAYKMISTAYGAKDDITDLIFAKTDSPFTQFRGRHDKPGIEIFADNTMPDGSQFDRLGIACVCRREDCSRLWPISAADTGNASARPYVCAEIWRDGDKIKVETDIDGRALDEPIYPDG